MITYGSTTLTSYNTITKIEVYYYKSTSATSLSGGSWSTTKPTWENGKYIWQKIRTTYEGKLENGQYYSESDPVNITGQQGATGTAAYSYKLNASDTTITLSKTGVYSTNKITFTATSKQGTGSVNAYAGRFKIETTVNGTTWTTSYTSSGNESSKEFTIPTGIIAIRCSLYQAGGTSTLLDIMTIPILNDDRPIATKTYTGLIGSANDAANASFYFAKIHPDSYTTNYKVKMKVRVTAPEAYAETIDIQFGGYGSTFSSFDAYTTRTGSIGVYYINLYRATQAGISTNHKGHALGIGLRSSTNPTSTSYKRTIIVDILELDGCTIEMLDTAVKYASIDGTGSTNYYGLTEMAVGTAGQNATNNTNTHYTQYSNNVKAGTNGIKGYTLVMKDSENTWACFYSGVYKKENTGKTAYTGGFMLGKILYSAGAGTQTSDSSLDTYYNYKSGVNTSTVYDAYPIDLRYSTNCASTLTSQRPVYIVGTIENDGLFHLDVSQWWTQTEPTYADGKVYIYVGMAYSTYQVWLSTENPAYVYYDGEFILYDKAQTLQNIDSLKTSLETQIDSKVETWCQKTNPASSWTAEERPNHTGDLWYYIGESGTTYKNNTTYQYNGSTNTWSAYSANPDLFDKIDGKTAIYYGTQSSVTSAEEGDYLVDSTDGSSYRWNNGAWVKVTDYKTAINNIQIGGRNLFGIGSDCAVSLGGLINRNFSIVTEDEYKCAHATGALQTTAYLQSNIPFIPKPLEKVVFSADIKIKNIALGTTNPMCEFYFGGQNIDGAWRSIKSAETYVDGEFISIANRKFNGILNSNEWHRVTVKAQFPDVIYTNNILPAIYLRDCTGEIFVKNVKYERGTQATDWTPAPEDTTASIQAYVDTLQFQVDHMAEIYYGTAVPTLSNTPASDWDTNDIKDIHVDDLYYNTSTGYCYRFTKSGSTYSWTRIKDSDITAAATAASNANTAAGNAQTTANNANTLAGQKRRIFVAQPTPPYEVGDLWVEGSNGDIKKCKTARATGSYTASDWELASKYTDDTLANEANDKIDNLEIGGRNILLNSTTNFPVKYGSSTLTTQSNVAIPEFNCTDGLRCYGKTGTGNSLCLLINTTSHGLSVSSATSVQDQQYVLSMYIKNNHETNPFFVNSNIPSISGTQTIQPGEAKRVVFYATGNNYHVIQIVLKTNAAEDDYDITFWHPQIELGNKVTDWSPAPEDTDASIQQVQNNLNNLEIGGRNLLPFKDCPSQTLTRGGITLTKEEDGWIRVSGTRSGTSLTTFTLWQNPDGDTYTAPINSYVPQNGNTNQFTLSVEIEGTPFIMGNTYTNSTHVVAYGSTGGTSWRIGGINGTSIIGVFPTYMSVIKYYVGANSTGTVNGRFRVKLERGNKATNWTPAPEDTQADIDTALAQSVEYIIGTQTAATGTWTGATTDNELKIGKTIAYKLPYAGSGNASLVLTLANGSTTDAIPVYLNTTRVTTHFGVGSVINMTYDGQYWRASSIPNTNNYDRRQHSNAITAKTAITAGHLIVGDSTGYQQITSTSGGSLEFDLGYPILWAYSAIAATKTSTATYEAYPSVNFSTSGTIQDGATNKMLWLKGTIRGNIFTLASTNFLTTQIPTSDDGMYYIPLGIMSSATAGYFSSSNRIYAYIDEEFQPLDNAAALKASSAYETAVQARSEIVQTQQTLSLQIRDISVGGANLFERTKTFEGTANQSTAHDSFTEFVYKDLTVKSANTITFGNQVVELSAYQYTDLTSNMWYSFSFYAKGNVDIGFMYAGTGNAVIDSIDVSWDDNTYTGFNTTSTSSNIIWLTPTSNWQRYSVVFHIEEQDITALHRLIGLYARPVNGYTELATENKDILITETGTDVHLIMEGNEVQICGYKLELGNKPTDWTPADNDKATYDNIISQINLSKEGIAIRADKIRLEGMITANEGFSIDEYGNMTANNGTFNGIFESYATEINENTFDLSINNGHIQFYNNDRTLTEDERYVGYIGGIRKNTSFIDGSIKNNDAITIGLYNNSDFLMNAYDDTTPTPICEVLNYVTGKPTFNFWVPARIYDGNKLQMYSRNESHSSQIEFRRYSKNTGGYVSRGSLSLHPIQDNSDISDRLYLLSKNQGNDLAGDQFLYFAGKGLRYSSSGQPMRTGYVATDKYIVTQYFSLPDLTIAKNTSQNFTIDVSRDGYTPIMCIPKVGSGYNPWYLSIYTWSMSGNIVTIRTRNISSTYDVSNVTISLQVLYKLTY